jgi:large subunit ribosomal protein L4
MATKTSKVDLPAEIFDVEVNIPLIHQVVVAQQAAARQGSHSTKSRGEVRGGGRKPYKQKGTGRARQGSIRAPQFTGGGVVHGPQPRSYDQRTPKKMKAAALRGALSDRARDGRIHVVDDFGLGDVPSTKTALASLAAISDRHRFLVVLERTDAVTWLSLRNAPEAHIVAVDQLNTYDVVGSDDVVFTRGAFDAFVGGTAGASRPTTVNHSATVAEAAPEAEQSEKVAEKKAAKKASAPKKKDAADLTEALADGGQDFPGAVKANEDGSGPEGYEIKGNAQSMKYHAPGGRWYDSTVAEFWFETAEDAQAAGFLEAGSKASVKATHDADADNGEDDK